MAIFRVIYEIDIETDTAEDAALEAFGIMTDPESILPVFDVILWDVTEDGEATTPEYDSGERENAVTIDCASLTRKQS